MLAKLKKRKRLRVHGYLKRSSTASGKNVLKNRRRKGRQELTVSYPKRYQEINGKAKYHVIPWGKAKKSPFAGKSPRELEAMLFERETAWIKWNEKKETK